MEHLKGALRTYTWGSRTLLADLRGTASPAPTPEAELWFGAHPAAPSTIDGRGLDELIAADPRGALGERVVEKFGEQLPFLVKLLAAGAPLSLQAHPSKEQALAGFQREEDGGLDLHDPRRNYKDPNHKPELIVALTPFQALAGFRPFSRTAELLAVLDAPGLNRYTAMVDPADEEASLRALFTTLISLPRKAAVALVEEVEQRAREVVQGELEEWMREVLTMYLELVEAYPGDIGALAALLLNYFNLHPGEALYLDAGQLHAYQHGLGVEIMANSDNVLRGGLTSKHVDVPELVRVLKFHALTSPRPETSTSETGEEFILPIEDFRLGRHRLAGEATLKVNTDGPAIVLCTAGEAIGSGQCILRPGEAVWIPASDPRPEFRAREGGQAELFYASV
ncbi:mannose-6-phosphate isomerase, class I [Corynebacterium sp. HMSC071B10]|uniref:mannose-6-phosphate isomerase, class I n=1 Tax=Corynebacterium sp. HMSC071B10 TaxID=1739494 RepID=UPI0008A24305|nr:mannose-6-phosphate isomerase, class I [Corynebacterium sp. HMSC071B10]OFP34125.1 mannose-6-phosphate isomerase [Corynebacterium sp. HMSC071B10]